MQRAASRIDGGYARWRQDNMLLLHVITHITEKSGLTRTGFTGQEERLTGVLDKIERILKLLVVGVYHYFSQFLSSAIVLQKVK
jgi:Tfp pilus assembly protein PilO